MIKYLKFILLLGLLILVVIYYNKSSDIRMRESKELLKNNIVFEGKVLDFKRSNNHAFGIIKLEVIESNVKVFNKTLEKGIYPYRIENGIAEVYCTVLTKRKRGDIIKVVSDDQMIYYNPLKSKERGDLFIIVDLYNINFVKNNTSFE